MSKKSPDLSDIFLNGVPPAPPPIRRVDDDPELVAKIERVLTLCEELGISISHEDCHGAFIIEDWDEHNADWLRDAFDERKRER